MCPICIVRVKFTQRQERLNAERRRLPVLKIDKERVFDGRQAERSLEWVRDHDRYLAVD